jgi:uncharacterized membrane protein
MKKFLTFIFSLLVLTLLIPQTKAADIYFDIKDFHSDITIDEDGSLEVTETIDVFFKEERHGIYRDLDTQNISVRVKGVVDQNGKPWKYTLEDFDLGTRIKIGDANINVKGDQTYKITYDVTEAIQFFDDHDELYWNVTGNFWSASIGKASAIVDLPSGIKAERTACYTGSYGSSEEDCVSEIAGNTVRFESAKLLDSREGMTIVVGIPKGVLTEPTKLKVMSNVENSSVYVNGDYLCKTECTIDIGAGTYQVQLKKFGYTPSRPISLELSSGKTKETMINLKPAWWFPVSKILIIIILIFIAIKPIINFWKKGRDPKGRGTIIPEYDPPDKLTPVLMGSLVDERADMRDITSTLIHLAVRGFIKIIKIPGKKIWIFKTPDDYELIRHEPKPGMPRKLSEFESRLLDDIFGNKQHIKLSDLKNKFYKNLQDLKEMVYKKLVEKEYFLKSPEETRTGHVLWGMLIIFVGFAILVAEITVIRTGFTALIMVNGILTLLFAGVMPQKTAKGKRAYEHILGFKLYLETAEKDRVHFQEREHLFYKFLPYAMTLGIAKKWSNAFGDVFKKPPEWYSGDGGEFRLPVFVSNLNKVSSQIQSSFASRPGSSGGGGSGFSGGFSGGGFGGGGGGSW